MVLHGLGGVGKTQLTLRYLDLHRSNYPDGSFWLRADQAATLIGDLASLAWRITPPLPEREEPEQERQVEAVLRWLREHQRWLLVLDNLDQPASEAMRHWLPPGLPGHMIVTSRSPQGSHRLSLEPLPLEVASSFLLDRTDQTDATAARAIAEGLDGLPLALEQAAAYVVENPWRRLADYARLLRSRMTELLREGKPDDYPLPVASTWDLSFQRLEQEQPAAADLLRLCAFLAPDDVPIAVLQAAASQLPDRLRAALEDELECDRTLRGLCAYSLLQHQESGLRIHRLVQWVMRELLAAEQWEQWLGAAVRLVATAFPGQVEAPERWSLCTRLLSHAQVVTGLAAERTVEPVATSWLLDRAASYLQMRGEYAFARPFFEHALAIRERVPGPDHPNTAASLNNLAGLLKVQGDLVAARPLLERALAIYEQALGPDHPGTAASLDNLASLLRSQDDLAAARSLFERALAIKERVLGPDHPDTATSLNNLALLLQAQGDLAAARPLFERTLATRERLTGPDHPHTATSLNNLGVLLRDQGDLDAAKPLLEHALAVRERVLGPEHPATAGSLNNLAVLLRDQGDLDAARSLLERALPICQRTLGADHPETAANLSNLAVVLKAQGDLAGARPLFERALAIFERSLGPDHLRTAFGRQWLAELPAEDDHPAGTE